MGWGSRREVKNIFLNFEEQIRDGKLIFMFGIIYNNAAFIAPHIYVCRIVSRIKYPPPTVDGTRMHAARHGTLGLHRPSLLHLAPRAKTSINNGQKFERWPKIRIWSRHCVFTSLVGERIDQG